MLYRLVRTIENQHIHCAEWPPIECRTNLLLPNLYLIVATVTDTVRVKLTVMVTLTVTFAVTFTVPVA